MGVGNRNVVMLKRKGVWRRREKEEEGNVSIEHCPRELRGCNCAGQGKDTWNRRASERVNPQQSDKRWRKVIWVCCCWLRGSTPMPYVFLPCPCFPLPTYFVFVVQAWTMAGFSLLCQFSISPVAFTCA